MAQLTIYLDEETRERISRAADEEGVSVSSWVRRRIATALEDEWPEGYFEVFGNLEEEDLERPPQPDWSSDLPRERV